MQRRAPIIAAMMPDNYHEVFLYILNFLMVVQGFKVWQNWRHSPASAMIRKWQASRVARMLKKRELRRIQRRAARELTKAAADAAALSGTGGKAMKAVAAQVTAGFIFGGLNRGGGVIAGRRLGLGIIRVMGRFVVWTGGIVGTVVTVGVGVLLKAVMEGGGDGGSTLFKEKTGELF